MRTDVKGNRRDRAFPCSLFEPLECRQLLAAAAAVTSAYLIGNSMTDGVRYPGFIAMLGRDGNPVQLGRQTGPGYTQAFNFNLKPGYITSGVDPARPTLIDPWKDYQNAFAASSWQALTLQLNDRRILSDVYNGQNEAEVPVTIEFMRQFRDHSPQGQAFAYSRPVRRTDLNDDGTPSGIKFDYSAEYLKPYVESGTDRNFNITTRSFTTQFMQQVLHRQHTDLEARKMKQIRLIPGADSYYFVDQMIKAGKFAGTYVKSMLDMYVDKSHPSDTAAYVLALTFYSSITGHDPRGVAPPAAYTDKTPALKNTKVQALLQQAVYQAMTYSGYAGWTTPIASSIGTGAGTGSIRMTVFNDADHDGVRDSGEGVMSGVKVFLDADNDGIIDSGEKSATTNGAGQVTFAGLAAGSTQHIRIVPLTNTKATTANPIVTTVTKNATKDVLTGLTKIGSISGRVFSDDNKNGKLDGGEALLGGRTVFIDLDGDNILDANEKRLTTDVSGNFKFTGLVSGTYRIRRVFPVGYRLSTPAANVTLLAGQNLTGVMIGAAKV